jgi:hypothetical protein
MTPSRRGRALPDGRQSTHYVRNNGLSVRPLGCPASEAGEAERDVHDRGACLLDARVAPPPRTTVESRLDVPVPDLVSAPRIQGRAPAISRATRSLSNHAASPTCPTL